MNGLMTEREWRRQAARPRPPRPVYWGAQCVLLPRAKPALRQDKAFHAFLMLLSLATALMMPALYPRAVYTQYPEAQAALQPGRAKPRSVSAVGYELPRDIPTQTVTYTQEQLLRGRLLLLDDAHPLPAAAPAPNTVCIASYGKGMVLGRGLGVRSGRATIQALTELFADLRAQGVSGLCVWHGTWSAAEQRSVQTARVRERLPSMTLGDAVRATLAETGGSAYRESQQEYSVEIRLSASAASVADERLLEATPQGQALLRLAWRHGFIRREPDGAGARAYRFRYVGQAHATAMTYLDLDMEGYLDWLHHKGTLTIHQGGALRYVILCKPITGSHVAFDVPAGAVCEYSADNTGYAIVACTMQP